MEAFVGARNGTCVSLATADSLVARLATGRPKNPINEQQAFAKASACKPVT